MLDWSLRLRTLRSTLLVSAWLVSSACEPADPITASIAAAGGGDAGALDAGTCADCTSDACQLAACVQGACVRTPVVDGVPCVAGATSLCVAGACVPRRCGDGFVEPGPDVVTEECDDGNLAPHDGCDEHCAIEVVPVDADDDYTSLGTDGAQNVGVDAQQRAFVVYRRRRNGLESLHGKRLGRYGAPVGDEAGLVLDAALGAVPTSADPTVVGLASGGWVVAWAAVREDSFDVVFRIVQPDGTSGPEIVANRFRRGTQWDPELVALSSGFVLAWTDTFGSADDPGAGVVARVFDGLGNGRTEDVRIAVDRAGNEGKVSLAASGSKWLAVWQTSSVDTSYLSQLRARAFDDLVPTSATETVVPFGPLDRADAIALPASGTYALLARYYGLDGAGDLVAAQLGFDGTYLAAINVDVTRPYGPIGGLAWARAPGGAPSAVYQGDVDGRAKLWRAGLTELPSSRARLGARLATFSIGQLSVVEDPRGLWFGFGEDVVDADQDVFSVFYLPSPDGARGTCRVGYEGPACAVRIPDCALSPCQNGGVCGTVANDPTPLNRCTCPSGYAGSRCELDANECASTLACGANLHAGACWNTVGSFTCTCAAGYRLQTGSGATTCVDVDECATNHGGCSTAPMVACTNTPGGHTCAPCPSGYLGDGTSCVDVDECATNHGGCDAHAVCTNLPGSVSCACELGYLGSGKVCAIADCGALPVPANASVVTPAGTTYQAIATYACALGFDRNGAETRTCQANAAWSGAAPSCDLVQGYCPSLSALAHATGPTLTGGVGGDGTRTYGASAGYVCDLGYAKTGADPVCRADHTWSSMPSCGVIASFCPAAPTVANASVTVGGGVAGGTTTSYGATASYVCATGYSKKAGSNSTCQADGTWSAPPTCTIVSCGALEAPAGGTVTTAGGTTYGQTASYACAAGYTMSGSATRTCQASGAWSGAAPTCTAISSYCPALSAPRRGSITSIAGGAAGGATTSVGASAGYACTRGLERSGPASRTCQANGTWSDVSPQCVENCFATDFDGDGKRNDHGCWNPANGQWTARRSDGTIIFQNVQWGTPGDVPLVGDMDADGAIDDLVIWTPSSGIWWSFRWADTTLLGTAVFGAEGDAPFVGDFDSDARVDDMAVWRPSGTPSFVFQSGLASVPLGVASDVPLVGNVAGTTTYELLVFRPSTGAWYSKTTANVVSVLNGGFVFGDALSRPTLGNFNTDALFDDLCIFREQANPASSGLWSVRHVGASSNLYTDVAISSGYAHGIMGDYDSDERVDDFGNVVSASGFLWSAIRTNGTYVGTMNGSVP